MDNIILIGMPGAGKSTVGVLLAKTLGYAFLDTDLVIQQREGALLQSLVDSLGVEAFLDVEADAICSVECRGTVIAPGGSAVCRERAMSHLKALGRIVYLHLPLEELERRLNNISTRGIAMAPGGIMPISLWTWGGSPWRRPWLWCSGRCGERPEGGPPPVIGRAQARPVRRAKN